MKLSMTIAFLISMIASGLSLAQQVNKQNRCGWLDNPSPGNHWLTDKDGKWIIAVQGGTQANGIELLAQKKQPESVNMNYGYGYSCACMVVVANQRGQHIDRIYKYEQFPLERCLLDKNIENRNITITEPPNRD